MHYTSCLPRDTWVDEDGVEGVDEDANEDVDDDHAGGGWSPPEAIPIVFSPSDLRR